jgi:hypothetical protein
LSWVARSDAVDVRTVKALTTKDTKLHERLSH